MYCRPLYALLPSSAWPGFHRTNCDKHGPSGQTSKKPELGEEERRSILAYSQASDPVASIAACYRSCARHPTPNAAAKLAILSLTISYKATYHNLLHTSAPKRRIRNTTTYPGKREEENCITNRKAQVASKCNLYIRPSTKEETIRFQKRQTYFDPRDYNMAKAKMKNKQLPSAGPDKNLVNGDDIPSPQICHQQTHQMPIPMAMNVPKVPPLCIMVFPMPPISSRPHIPILRQEKVPKSTPAAMPTAQPITKSIFTQSKQLGWTVRRAPRPLASHSQLRCSHNSRCPALFAALSPGLKDDMAFSFNSYHSLSLAHHSKKILQIFCNVF
ncbi:hypothetical protein GH733_000300 [Mirounga leonina]|nr:hypothetical protein GH733_000300 [Mirounga leonina]